MAIRGSSLHRDDRLDTDGCAARFVKSLRQNGFDAFVGVPCSSLKDALALIESGGQFPHVSATREDGALGTACGAYLGGLQPVVFMQNSGLGVVVNALASLVMLYEIPLLLVIGWRAHDGSDAPEHVQMGAITMPLLDLLGIHQELIAPLQVESQVTRLTRMMLSKRRPVALLVAPGVLGA